MCAECLAQCPPCDKQEANSGLVISLLASLKHFIQNSQKVQGALGVLSGRCDLKLSFNHADYSLNF